MSDGVRGMSLTALSHLCPPPAGRVYLWVSLCRYQFFLQSAFGAYDKVIQRVVVVGRWGGASAAPEDEGGGGGGGRWADSISRVPGPEDLHIKDPSH